MITIKILQICSYYYGTKLYKNLMDNLIHHRVDTTVFGPCEYNTTYAGDESYLVQAKCFNKWDRILFRYKYQKVYTKLIKEIPIQEYDLLHAHSLFANGYVAYRVFKDYHIPYVVAVRNTDINTFFKYFIHLKKLGIQILENASQIILISNAYKEKLKQYIPKEKQKQIESKCIVIPNGIDEYFHENRKETKKIDMPKLNLVYTGRIDANKNLITTIKCCDKILRHKYNVTLTVIGDIHSKRYKHILKKHNFIQYLGKKSKEEITEIYKNMDIFVMPSKHETFGLTYVEAMSQGLPVIYTKNEGFDQFFEEGTVGYPTQYNNYKEMGQKIDKIVKQYEKISQNCIEKSKKFNWNDIALQYVELYEKVMEN